MLFKKEAHCHDFRNRGTGCFCSVQAPLLNHLPRVNGKHKQDYRLNHRKQDFQELGLALPVPVADI